MCEGIYLGVELQFDNNEQEVFGGANNSLFKALERAEADCEAGRCVSVDQFINEMRSKYRI